MTTSSEAELRISVSVGRIVDRVRILAGSFPSDAENVLTKDRG